MVDSSYISTNSSSKSRSQTVIGKGRDGENGSSLDRDIEELPSSYEYEMTELAF